MNKKTLYLTALALLFAACQTEVEMTTAPAIVGEVESQPNSRTVLSVDESGVGTISWKPADQIDVFFGTTRAQYTSQNTSDVASAVFMTTDMVGPNDITSTNIWGLYPSNSTSNCDGSSVKTTLPAAQKGVPDTFDDDLFIAAAHSTTPTLQFKNVCGSIRFSLYRDDIVSVVFKGNDNEDIAGDISISFVGGVPVASVVNGVKEITLTPKTGATFAKDTFYHIVALPATLTQGFTMTFTTTSGATGTFNFSDKPIAIKRSTIAKKPQVDIYTTFSDGAKPNNVIYYTSSDGKIVTPYRTDVFGANIVSNEYVNGQGIIVFDGPVTKIGEMAFYNCDSLISIVVPESSTAIGGGAFSYCDILSSVVIPNSVNSIKNQAFRECVSLPSISIPDGINVINDGTFMACSLLSSIDLPKSVSRIGHSAFQGCSSLSRISIPEGVSDIGSDAFENCKSLTSIIIPNTIRIINKSVFWGCEKLSFVSIPNGVKSIEDRAFNGCSSLESLTIPNTVLSIGEGAFSFSGLLSIVIPETVTSIGQRAFEWCKNLTSIELSSSITSIGDYTFNQCYGLSSIRIPEKVNSIGRYAFHDCGNLSSVDIPNSVTSIGEYAFDGCRQLKAVSIPEGVTRIEDHSFDTCQSLTTVKIPESLAYIGEFAFSGCFQLDAILIPENVTYIGRSAFSNCQKLIAVVIPSKISFIGDSAFSWCIRLSSITVSATIVPTIGTDVFDNDKSFPIYVHDGLVSAYQAAEGWSNYSNRIKAWSIPVAVDLGLSVKWANCNIGAWSPEEFGEWFAWGEVIPKRLYRWSNYAFCSTGETAVNDEDVLLSKYNVQSEFGSQDYKSSLDLVDDAAFSNWGDIWRMPSAEEIRELQTECLWTWTTLNGRKGYMVTGQNGNSIFLPAAGRRQTELNADGDYGYYWSSSLNADDSLTAYSLYFFSNRNYLINNRNSRRCIGYSIRPVTE